MKFNLVNPQKFNLSIFGNYLYLEKHWGPAELLNSLTTAFL